MSTTGCAGVAFGTSEGITRHNVSSGHSTLKKAIRQQRFACGFLFPMDGPPWEWCPLHGMDCEGTAAQWHEAQWANQSDWWTGEP